MGRSTEDGQVKDSALYMAFAEYHEAACAENYDAADSEVLAAAVKEFALAQRVIGMEWVMMKFVEAQNLDAARYVEAMIRAVTPPSTVS